MNNTTTTFKSVLRKFRFETDVPTEIRSHIYNNKKILLQIILKRINEYGIVYLLLISTFFALRNFGLKVSLFNCKLILLGAVITASGSITYFTYQKVYHNDKKVVTTENTVIVLPEKEAVIIQKEEPIKLPTPPQKYILRINEIEYTGSDSVLGRQVSDKLFSSMTREGKGQSVILSTAKIDGISASSTLVGRIHQIGGKYILTVKIVDSKDSSIKFSRTISFNENDNLDSIVDNLAESIISNDLLWK